MLYTTQTLHIFLGTALTPSEFAVVLRFPLEPFTEGTERLYPETHSQYFCAVCLFPLTEISQYFFAY